MPLGTRKLELARQQAGTALRPRGPPLRRAGAPIGRFIGLPGEKIRLCPRAWEIMPDKLIVYRSDFLLRRGARGLRGLRSRAGPPTNKVERTPTKAPTGPRGERAILRIAGAFGQETFSVRATPISQRKTTKTALPSNTRPQNKKAGRRKSIYTSPPQFLLRVVDRRYPPTPPAQSLPPGKHRRKFRSRCRSTRR